MEPDDIFIQRSNTPELVGSAAMYRGARNWAIFPDLLIRARVNERADPAYVELVLRSGRLRRYFRDAARGIAGSMPKISQSTIENAPLRLPDRPRQAEIVRTFETRALAVERQRQAIDRARARSRILRQSILGAAFSGRLVPQDPRDEPASVLLERIAADRATSTTVTRRRKPATS
jgi:type I restriction enzyme S subunit